MNTIINEAALETWINTPGSGSISHELEWIAETVVIRQDCWDAMSEPYIYGKRNESEPAIPRFRTGHLVDSLYVIPAEVIDGKLTVQVANRAEYALPLRTGTYPKRGNVDPRQFQFLPDKDYYRPVDG